jgi:hypothetical protein
VQKTPFKEGKNLQLRYDNRLVHYGDAGDFQHAIGIVKPFYLDQSDCRKMLPKYLLVCGP